MTLAAFTDPFTGSGALSGSYTTFGGTQFVRSSNLAAPVTIANADRAIVTGTTFAADQFAQFVLGTLPSADGSQDVLILRGASDGSNSYFCQINASGFSFYKRVAYSDTSLQSYSKTMRVNDHCRAEICGSIIRLRVNWVIVASRDVGVDTASGSPGMGFYSAVNLNARVGSFACGDLNAHGAASVGRAFARRRSAASTLYKTPFNDPGTGVVSTLWNTRMFGEADPVPPGSNHRVVDGVLWAGQVTADGVAITALKTRNGLA